MLDSPSNKPGAPSAGFTGNDALHQTFTFSSYGLIDGASTAIFCSYACVIFTLLRPICALSCWTWSQISAWATLTRGPSFSSSFHSPFAFICFLSFSFCFLTVSTLCQSKKKNNKKVIAYIRMCKCTITIKY